MMIQTTMLSITGYVAGIMVMLAFVATSEGLEKTMEKLGTYLPAALLWPLTLVFLFVVALPVEIGGWLHRKFVCDSDRSGEADETAQQAQPSGESAGRSDSEGIAQ